MRGGSRSGSLRRADTAPLVQAPLSIDDPAAAYMPSPDTPDREVLRVQTMATIRRLLKATAGTFTEQTIPAAEIGPLSHAVGRLRAFENKKVEKTSGLQGKRLAIRTWYEQALLASSAEARGEKADMLHTPRQQSSEL